MEILSYSIQKKGTVIIIILSTHLKNFQKKQNNRWKYNSYDNFLILFFKIRIKKNKLIFLIII